ncbi:chaperone modulator CbpM [Alloyangia pacifica]|uniref:Chaperone modulatory protein CbpM n=1 Tax=Alloyangia pacifica TaxID=311180 RepID=A0A1I6UHM2_9RHOB|nr:chaperone modulator CbpM [Alloyangia pacifica]SDH69911.1 chaperone modulatory protein CbpM [Alloyangia pacifica]SFT00787.1 chaperone modulatory protein CbpM [Alloyangia pacifica]
MTPVFYSEQEVLATVGRLDQARLTRFLRTEVITPAEAHGQTVYRQVDIARMELLCDLCDDFELNDEALALVMQLIDQLHGTRGDLVALMRALGEEPEEVKIRVQGRLGR